MGYKVLLVEDDEEWALCVESGLKADGFAVESCALAARAFERIRRTEPDLVLLDLNLPDMGGLTWLTALRETEYGRELPVIIMSGRKNEDEVAQAFDLGIDDYLQKPFVVRELLARIRALLRRRFERAEQLGSPLSIGGIELDPARRLCLVRGKRVNLRPREFVLLEILMRKAGRVLSRTYLLETVWAMSRFSNTRAVDVTISRLRKRIGDPEGKNIETVETLGYCFRDPRLP